MKTDVLNQLEELSPESLQKLSGQIERVQAEARKLRAEARRLRRAQKIKLEKSQSGFKRIRQSLAAWGQRILKRGSDLASSGTALAKTQLDASQQKVRERGENLVQGLSQRRSQTVQSLADWRDSTTENLRKRGQSLAQNTSNWGEDTTYLLQKQRRGLSRTLSDWGEEAAYKLRKQGKHLAQKLGDQKEDAAHKLRKQGRYVVRNLSDKKEDAAHKLRKQGRYVVRNLTGRKEDATERLREQSQQLIDRSGQLLEPVRQRGRKVWPIIGFLSGLLLAGGVTFWLVRRALKQPAQEEKQIELSRNETLNGTGTRPGGEVHYVGQGGTAVATRPDTETEKLNKFVGVLSTRQYYPIEQKPDVGDLVFFVTEADARAEGFKAAR